TATAAVEGCKELVVRRVSGAAPRAGAGQLGIADKNRPVDALGAVREHRYRPCSLAPTMSRSNDALGRSARRLRSKSWPPSGARARAYGRRTHQQDIGRIGPIIMSPNGKKGSSAAATGRLTMSVCAALVGLAATASAQSGHALPLSIVTNENPAEPGEFTLNF